MIVDPDYPEDYLLEHNKMDIVMKRMDILQRNILENC
jgi:hypothetical protein